MPRPKPKPASKQSSRRNAGESNRRWGRIVGWSALGLVVLVVGGLFGGYLWIKSYLQSDEFRQMVSQQTSAAFEADGQYQSFRWEGTNVTTAGYEATGKPGAFFAKAKARDIDASINLDRAWDGVWEVSKVYIGRLDLEIDEVKQAELENSGRAAGESASPSVASDTGGEDEKGFLESLLPDKVEILQTTVAEINMNVRHEDGSRSMLKDLGLIVKNEPSLELLSFTGSGGRLSIPSHPGPVRINAFQATLNKKDEISITDLAMQIYGDAEADITGDVVLGDDPDMDLRANLRAIDVKHLIDSDVFSEMIFGSMSGKLKLTGDPTDSSRQAKRGELIVSGGALQAHPALMKVAEYTGVSRFRNLKFSDVSFEIDDRSTMVRVKKIEMVSDGLLKLTGDLDMRSEGETTHLDGRFELGVSHYALENIPGANRVFSQNREGLLWTPVRVTGTTDNPNIDLLDRLVKEFGWELLEAVPGVARDVAEVVAKTGVGVAKTGTDVVAEGVKAVVGEGPNAVKTGAEVGTDVVGEGVKVGTDLIKGGADLIKGATNPLKGLIPLRP